MRLMFFFDAISLVFESKFGLVLYLLSLFLYCLTLACLLSTDATSCHCYDVASLFYSIKKSLVFPQLTAHVPIDVHFCHAFCGPLHLNLYAPLVDMSLTLRSYPSFSLSLIVGALTRASLIVVVDTLPFPCHHFPLYIRLKVVFNQ